MNDDKLAKIASAVLEAYYPEGVLIWWDNWIHADEQRRAKMERGVLNAWSGEKPKPYSHPLYEAQILDPTQ